VAYAQPDCDGAGLFAPAVYNALVTVSAGGTASGINLALGSEATVTGRVKGLAGAKLSGICVAAVGTSPGSTPVIATTTAGTYSIGGLLPGSYRVRFASGCGASGYRTQWWKDASSPRLATIIRVKAGSSIAGINASLRQ
jgi:hypothetical protein